MHTVQFTKLALAISICSGIAVGCSSTSTTTTQTDTDDEEFEVVAVLESTPLSEEQPVQQPKPVQSKEMEQTVHFNFDSAQLAASEEEKLQALVESVDDNGQETKAVIIEGYADATGPEEYNHHLSKQRAQKVEDYLKARDIEVSSWDVEAHGENNPAASNDNKEGRAENRRVVVTVKSDRQQPRVSTR